MLDEHTLEQQRQDLRSYRIVESVRNILISFAPAEADINELHPGDIFPSLRNIKFTSDDSSDDLDADLARSKAQLSHLAGSQQTPFE